MKFTDRSIRALKPKAERYEVWEDNGKGLGIRVSPTGRKSWVFMYRFNGKARRMTFGVYGTPPKNLSLADAHIRRAEALKLLEQGIDPGTVDQDAKQEARRAPTVQQLADEYLEKWAKPRKRSWREDKRILDKDVIPAWGTRKAKDITRRDVILLLDKIVDRGAPISANRTLAVIRKMFNFALSRDIVPATPCTKIPAPSQENRRDRVLTQDEIKAFWNGLDKADMTEGSKLALKLQLLTAQRKGEVAQARWDEFDLEHGWWTIPAERSKNKLPHRVPLSPQALEVLREIKKLSRETHWLFPSPRKLVTNTDDGTPQPVCRPITPESLDRAVRNNIDKLGGTHFTPHDLRRTAASMMAGMGTPRLVVKKVLNHAESDVTAIYDRHSYDAEKRKALNAWGRKLAAILGGKEGNVVPLRHNRKNAI